MTTSSFVMGIVLFATLSVVIYFVFPILLRSEVASVETHLINHEQLSAHPSATGELHRLEIRVAVLEAAMRRLDSRFHPPVDSLHP